MIALLDKTYIPLILIILLAYTAKTNWSDGQWENVIEADAKGYYAYLPALFIYKDLNFSFYGKAEVENAYNPNLVYDYRAYYNDKCLNKYYVGESILLAPFYLTAHIISKNSKYRADGYSKLYVIAITIAALFYLGIGLIALRRTLFLFGISKLNSILVILTLVFGTNLFYYAIGEVGLSHVYSFSMISIFINQVAKYFQTFQTNYIISASILIGIIVLIRPINALVVLSIPFLSQNSTIFLNGLKKYFFAWKNALISIGIILFIVSIQLIIYKIQTGSFFVYSYGKEAFNFSSPQLINFLFSYKKGFFLYTPICFIALLGFASLKNDKFKLITLFSFLFLVVYILSSWWMWFYGGSFSSRVMVDYLPYFALLLGFLFQNISKSYSKYILISILFLLTLVNQIQTLQYCYYVIHWSNMNKETYCYTFLYLGPVLDRRKEIK